MEILKRLFTSLIMAGGIVLMIGLYYLVIKAGIPFQDAPAEIAIRYAVHMEVGENLSLIGFCILAVGVIARVATGVICKKQEKKA